MFPEFSIGSFTVKMYGVMMLLGFVLAYLVLKLQQKRLGLELDMFYLAAFAIIGGFIGSKILYIITVFPEMAEDIRRIGSGLRLRDFAESYIFSGFVYYGGYAGGVLGVAVYLRQQRRAFSECVNAVIPAIPLAHAVGRVGCFCAGCCYGKVTDGPLGVVFPGAGSQPRLPAQLFETAGNLIIFAALMLICSKKQKRPVGLAVYGILYSVMRFIIEFYRSDDIRGFVGVLSTSQFIGIFVFILAVLLLIFEKPVYAFADRLTLRPGKPGAAAEPENAGSVCEQPEEKTEEQPGEKAEEQPEEKTEEQPEEKAEEQPEEKPEEQPREEK